MRTMIGGPSPRYSPMPKSMRVRYILSFRLENRILSLLMSLCTIPTALRCLNRRLSEASLGRRFDSRLV